MNIATAPIVAPVRHRRNWPPQSGQPDSSFYHDLESESLRGPPSTLGDENSDLAKRMAIYGFAGVFGASVLTAGITAATFHAYRKSGSVLMPALIAGLGSMATGGVLLWLLIRSSTQTADDRLVYAAAGAQLTM